MAAAAQMEAMARKMEAQIMKQRREGKAAKIKAPKAAPVQEDEQDDDDDDDEDDVSVRRAALKHYTHATGCLRADA